MFGVYVFSGLPGTILALYYKVPVSGTYSIPGATLMGTALAGYSFNEATGAFIIAGVIALIIGLSGAIEKIMQFLPLEIVMAMVGGAMMKFGSGIVTTTQVNPPGMWRGGPGLLPGAPRCSSRLQRHDDPLLLHPTGRIGNGR